MYKTDGEHAAHGRLPFEGPLHPVVVLGARIRHDNDVAFPERQLVFVIGRTIVESLTPRIYAFLLEIEVCLKFKIKYMITIIK